MSTRNTRLDELAALVEDARRHAADPQYARGDVTASILAFCLPTISETQWELALAHARRVYCTVLVRRS